jgi:ceramide glucosyltransferase
VKLVWLVFLPALAYQALACVAGLAHVIRRKPTPNPHPPGISVLKPIRGLDPDMPAAFDSQVSQDYLPFELLFGIQSSKDPALREIEQLRAAYPDRDIQLHVGAEPSLNRKVGVLQRLATQAKYPLWVVNDSDIRVTPDYLAEVSAPLIDPSIGIVTCLYRPKAHSVPAAWEALGIATDFMPSTLVAPLVGVREFGLGSTLCFRAADFAAAGGFAAVADYIADDYQVGRRITQLGKRAVLSTYVVETSLGDTTWSGVWQHQLRWGRTIRLSKSSGYAGLPVTHAGVWMLFALVLHLGWIAAGLGILRILSSLITGWFVLRSRAALYGLLLTPLWDFFAFAVWIGSYMSATVQWRDRSLRLGPEGRIEAAFATEATPAST